VRADRRTLSEEEASDLVRRLASAIAYMHSMEIIHRDLKPGARPSHDRHASVVFTVSPRASDAWRLYAAPSHV
jgi:hypothetical protein